MNHVWYWLASALDALAANWRWMAWNSFLALIPLALSLWLFRKPRSPRSPLQTLRWIAGFSLFMAFLPNAPYVLTDIIHLVYDIRYRDWSIWLLSVVVVPYYLVFFAIGAEAYTLSLMNFGRWLRRQGRSRWILTLELMVHFLCAVGIYLGRFLRFNSWDFVTQGDTVILETMTLLTRMKPLAIILLTWVILTAVHSVLKGLTWGAIATWRQRQRQQPLAKSTP